MENKKDKVKKFAVTRSIRMPSKWMKFFFYGGCTLAGAGVILAISCLIRSTTDLLGVAIIVAILGAIWVGMVVFNSAGNYGVSMVSFGDKHIKFYYYKDEYKLDWEDVIASGIEKTRWSYWVYLSDHELSEEEKVEFPEHAKDGVMYFNYRADAWDEMMKFSPENIKAELDAKKAEIKKLK